MPYIVTTKRRYHEGANRADGSAYLTVFRRAVATLDEARRSVANLALGVHWDDANRDTCSRWVVRARNLSESGGTVGPLPDGTEIEVTAWSMPSVVAWLDAHHIEFPADPAQTVAIFCDAFNARHAS